MAIHVTQKKAVLGSPNRFVALIFLWVAFTCAYLDRQGVGPLASFMRKDLALTAAQVGFFTSASSMGFLISSLPAGRLADMFGTRWVVFTGLSIGGISMMSVLLASSFTMVLVILFLVGFGLGFVNPATSRGIVEWFPAKERATAMGIKTTGLNVAGIITGATLPILALTYNWRVAFMMPGAVALICAVLVASFYRDPPRNSIPPAAIKAEETVEGATQAKRERWWEMFKTREIWLLFFSGTATNVPFYVVTAYLVLFLKDALLVPVVAAGIILSFTDAAGLVGKIGGGLISDRIFGGNRKEVYIGLLVITFAVALILASLRSGIPTWLIYLCGFIFGLGAVSSPAFQITLVGEFGGRGNVGMAAGGLLVFNQIGSIFGVPIFGAIVDRTHSYAWAWLYVAGAAFVSIILAGFLREEKKKITT